LNFGARFWNVRCAINRTRSDRGAEKGVVWNEKKKKDRREGTPPSGWKKKTGPTRVKRGSRALGFAKRSVLAGFFSRRVQIFSESKREKDQEEARNISSYFRVHCGGCKHKRIDNRAEFRQGNELGARGRLPEGSERQRGGPVPNTNPWMQLGSEKEAFGALAMSWVL